MTTLQDILIPATSGIVTLATVIATLRSSLDNIKKSLDEIKADLKEQKEQSGEHASAIAVLNFRMNATEQAIQKFTQRCDECYRHDKEEN